MRSALFLAAVFAVAATDECVDRLPEKCPGHEYLCEYHFFCSQCCRRTCGLCAASDDDATMSPQSEFARMGRRLEGEKAAVSEQGVVSEQAGESLVHAYPGLSELEDANASLTLDWDLLFNASVQYLLPRHPNATAQPAPARTDSDYSEPYLAPNSDASFPSTKTSHYSNTSKPSLSTEYEYLDEWQHVYTTTTPTTTTPAITSTTTTTTTTTSTTTATPSSPDPNYYEIEYLDEEGVPRTTAPANVSTEGSSQSGGYYATLATPSTPSYNSQTSSNYAASSTDYSSTSTAKSMSASTSTTTTTNWRDAWTTSIIVPTSIHSYAATSTSTASYFTSAASTASTHSTQKTTHWKDAWTTKTSTTPSTPTYAGGADTEETKTPRRTTTHWKDAWTTKKASKTVKKPPHHPSSYIMWSIEAHPSVVVNLPPPNPSTQAPTVYDKTTTMMPVAKTTRSSVYGTTTHVFHNLEADAIACVDRLPDNCPRFAFLCGYHFFCSKCCAKTCNLCVNGTAPTDYMGSTKVPVTTTLRYGIPVLTSSPPPSLSSNTTTTSTLIPPPSSQPGPESGAYPSWSDGGHGAPAFTAPPSSPTMPIPSPPSFPTTDPPFKEQNQAQRDQVLLEEPGCMDHFEECPGVRNLCDMHFYYLSICPFTCGVCDERKRNQEPPRT